MRSSSSLAPIAILGSGAVAQALGHVLLKGGAPIVAVASRTPARAQQAAVFIGSPVRPVSWQDVPGLATRVLIATADAAITSAAESLMVAGMHGGIALHTCGARGPEALEPLARTSTACGVLHPLQTLPTPEQGVNRICGSAFALAGELRAVQWGAELIEMLDGRMLSIASDQMPVYHAGAVMASNALTAVIDVAIQLLKRAGVDEVAAVDAIAPLSRAALDSVLAVGPQRALTGPIGRGDVETIEFHARALSAVPPAIAALYLAAGRSLVDIARRRGLPEATLTALLAALDTLTVEKA